MDDPHKIRAKATDTIRRHAGQYHGRDGRHFSVSAPEVTQFMIRFGWDQDRIARDIEHASLGCCPYHEGRYRDLSDMHLDIIDPRVEPYYRTNSRWCCATCNVEKGKKTPEEWARFQPSRRQGHIWSMPAPDHLVLPVQMIYTQVSLW